MKLTGLHILLSYCCTNECDHCFLWGSPWAKGTMTLAQVRDVLRQSKELGTVDMIYFEGGEPFLFYPIMLQGLREARDLGFQTGVVSNCYWATSVEDALQWLAPIEEIGIDDLSLSSDLFHGEAPMTQAAKFAIEAASQLGLPQDVISIDPPQGCIAYQEAGQGEPITGGQVQFRGRAAVELVEGVERHPWTEFTRCLDEDLANPGRLHVDAYGNLHICQGLVIGNLWHKPLAEIVANYDPAQHPIIAPLMEGGPAKLAELYGLPDGEDYADRLPPLLPDPGRNAQPLPGKPVPAPGLR